MASTRLSDKSRRKLVNAIVGQKIKPMKESVKARESQLSYAIYLDAYSESDRRKMARLPAGWLPEVGAISVKMGSKVQEYEFPTGATKRVPYKDRRYGSTNVLKIYGPGEPMATEAFAIEAEKDRISEEEDSLWAQVMSVVQSVNTLEKLVEAWPEVEPICRDVLAVRVVPNLPAVRVSDLTERLGLKKSKN